ncbi:hypothetical protein BT93_D0546 [Corymbia citriodora subsp. variegata]|nr:hypothetical protein BT93_D0546 [Corymbia citriodora subsp. variegata]
MGTAGRVSTKPRRRAATGVRPGAGATKRQAAQGRRRSAARTAFGRWWRRQWREPSAFLVVGGSSGSGIGVAVKGDRGGGLEELAADNGVRAVSLSCDSLSLPQIRSPFARSASISRICPALSRLLPQKPSKTCIPFFPSKNPENQPSAFTDSSLLFPFSPSVFSWFFFSAP